VSLKLIYGRAVLPAGAETKAAVSVTESLSAVPGRNVRVAVADDATVIVSPFATEIALVVEPAVFLIVKVSALTAAFEGATESNPKPNEATATSAIRLKFVFVDIYFLSLVVTKNFLVAASR
jgi:hypothetical protein